MFRLGLIINPIAGMGGAVGLKGTDGLADKARQLGACALAPAKAARALAPLSAMADRFLVMAPPNDMGEDAARAAGLCPQVADMALAAPTTGRDTRAAARVLRDAGADLILFAGGDGTARDICKALGETVPVLGIPAGVKIHSPVFARTPEAAGEMVLRLIQDRGAAPVFHPREVLDIDEDAFRRGRVQTRLYGYLQVPEERGMQGRKTGSQVSEKGIQNQIALDFIDRMERDRFYLVGPGSTMRPVMANLGLAHTLLGVDLLYNQALVASDASEQEILDRVRDRPFTIIITPIGGQGYLFGRGNHQISPRIIQKAGKENIWVGATLQKIGTLRGAPFLVDTGDPETDWLLAGYIRVTTGYRQEMIYPVT